VDKINSSTKKVKRIDISIKTLEPEF